MVEFTNGLTSLTYIKCQESQPSDQIVLRNYLTESSTQWIMPACLEDLTEFCWGGGGGGGFLKFFRAIN